MRNEPDRNSPCPCGSGQLYKFCCGLQLEVHGSLGGKGGLVVGVAGPQEDVWIQAEKKRDLEFLAEKPELLRRIVKEVRKGLRPFILVDRRNGVVQGFSGKDIIETITQLNSKVPAAEAIRSRLQIIGEDEFLLCVISGSGHTGLYRMMAPKDGAGFLKLLVASTPGRGH
jgi:hypothetical protein